MRPRLILLLAISAVAAFLIGPAITPLYIVNLSNSVPVGLYRLEGKRLQHGDLAVIHLGEPWRSLAWSRGYLASKKAWLIKPVAALAGDHVCRLGQVITINGRISAVAQSTDPKGRLLPRWDGCKSLAHGEIFLLSNVNGSFDGRYFGVTSQPALTARSVSWKIRINLDQRGAASGR